MNLWIHEKPQPDTYAAFRGVFYLDSETEVEIRAIGASWFVLWLDGESLMEGPARFERRHPEWGSTVKTLPPGEHILASQVHWIGATTRLLDTLPPFLNVHPLAAGREIPVSWKAIRLDGYRKSVRRINPQLGWVEWCDTAKNPEGWREPGFNDRDWPTPAAVDPGIGPLLPPSIAPVRSFEHTPGPLSRGELAQVFGYELDDPAARFFLRELNPRQLPAEGVWRRYDLGRVRLMRPEFVLDLPEGAVVEFAYSESLAHERVSPYINLSAGPSCNLDHYVARGGVQEFAPLTPRGGRYVEIHVLAPPGRVRFLREAFFERCYFGAPEGRFSCRDDRLNRIWTTGIETHRACAEDALTDNPTRERGQWTGDAVMAGMDIAAAGYSDLRLCRRSLMQSALCAREDGLIAGLCPGGPAWLSTYALLWPRACLHYHELTGERELLEQLFPYALKNMEAFAPSITDAGLVDELEHPPAWIFIDWGFVRNEGKINIAYNLYFLIALRAMVSWCRKLDRPRDERHFAALEAHVQKILDSSIHDTNGENAASPWPVLGYHACALALYLGLPDEREKAGCLDYLKSHLLDCFPNNPDAPRNARPGLNESRLITPAFSHFAFTALIENGEMAFVLDQFRHCWGWMLDAGYTTWLEVFDPRWTHCHQWSGCPTWMLSRYGLGLHPRFDRKAHGFELKLRPGDLDSAQGAVPLPDGGLARIEWTRTGNGFDYRVETTTPVEIELPSSGSERWISIRKRERLHLDDNGYLQGG